MGLGRFGFGNQCGILLCKHGAVPFYAAFRPPMAYQDSKAEPLLAADDVEAGKKPLLGYNAQGAAQPLLAATKKSHSSLGRVVSLARPEVGIIIVATIALFVATAATVAIPQFFGQMIDDVAVRAPLWRPVG